MFLIMFMRYNMLVYVFILQVVFLLSDSRGHEVNVKNIYGRRLDTQIVVGGCNTPKASGSK